MENKDINIILVDDDESYLETTKIYLERNKISVKTFINPKEAIDYLKNEKVDIVLLDYFMPQMTGEEFVKILRSFNTEVLIVLQTGFAEEKPPIEMLNNLNIQAYHDKTKGIEDLILLTLSAIKVIDLMRINKKQEQVINILNYKKEFLGNLITGLVNEAKDQVFTIALANKSKNEIENSELREKIIEDASKRLNDLFQALNFDTTQDIYINDLFKIANELMRCRLKTDLLNLNVQIRNEEIVVNNNVSNLIYVLIEIIQYLVSKNIKDIDIICYNEENKNYIKIQHNIDIDNIFIEKIKAFELKVDCELNYIIIEF